MLKEKIDYYKGLLKQKDNKTLLTNFVSLSSLQVINYLFPLIIIPYLARVLGIEKYGLVYFIQAFLTFFIVLSDYSFYQTAIREISINRDNKEKIKEIFNSVLNTKIFLSLCGFIIYSAIVISIPKFSKDTSAYLLSYLIVLGQALFPIWYFQGIEKMKYISIFGIISKIIFTLSIFIFIKAPSDYIYVNLLQGIGGVLTSIICIIFIVKSFKINLQYAGINAIIEQLRKGKRIFISNFAVNIYINTNMFILGIFGTEKMVGYYSIAEKVIYVIRQVINVFAQVIYPHVCKLTFKGQEFVKGFLKRTIIPMSLFIFIVCLLIFISSDYIVLLVTGEYINEISLLIKLLSFIPFIVVLNIPAYQMLLAYNFYRSYSKVLTSGAIISIGLNLILSYYFFAIGTSVSLIISELFVTLGLYFILQKNHPGHVIINLKRNNNVII